MQIIITLPIGLIAAAGKAAATLAHKKGIHEPLRITRRTKIWLNVTVIISHLQNSVVVLPGRLNKGMQASSVVGKMLSFPREDFLFGDFATYLPAVSKATVDLPREKDQLCRQLFLSNLTGCQNFPKESKQNKLKWSAINV